MPRKLSIRQQLFVAEYLIDLNATKSAERAGYSPKTARAQGARLLTNVNLSAAIAAEQADRFKRLRITADGVISEIAKIGFANMLDYIRITDEGSAVVDLSGLTAEQAAAIGEVTIDEYAEAAQDGAASQRVKRIRFKLLDKRAALVDLCRHLKLFTDRTEVDAKGRAPITVAMLDAIIADGDAEEDRQ